MSTSDLPEVADFTLDKALVESLANAAPTWLHWLALGLGVLVIVFSYLGHAIRLLYMVPVAPLLLVSFKATGRPWGFGESYKLGVFGMRRR